MIVLYTHTTRTFFPKKFENVSFSSSASAFGLKHCLAHVISLLPLRCSEARPDQMENLQYSVGYTTGRTTANNMHQPRSRYANNHSQVIQAAKNLQSVQSKAFQQPAPRTSTVVQHGASFTSQNDVFMQMYNWQVALTMQLQAAYNRLQTTESQLEEAQAKANRATSELQCMKKKVAELERQIKSQSVMEYSQKPAPEFMAQMQPSDDPFLRKVSLLPRTKKPEALDLSANHWSEKASYFAPTSSNSSVGTPGTVIFDHHPLSSSNHNVRCPRTLVTPQATPHNSTPHDMSPKAISTLQASPEIPGVKLPPNPTRQLDFRGRLTELFQSIATFAHLYTNRPDSLMTGTLDMTRIVDLTAAKDHEVRYLMSKQGTRRNLVTRLINQFITRQIFFYELVRGFNTTTDSEIRQLLDHLYSDTPWLVRGLVYTHLANQVLELRGSPSFCVHFQAKQSSNANDLLGLISPLVVDLPSMAPSSQCKNMRADFLTIIQTAHDIALDMLSNAYEFKPLWPATGDRFDSGWMANRDAGVIGHKVKTGKNATIELATSPAIWFVDYTKNIDNQKPELLLRANVTLHSKEEGQQ